MKRKDIRKGDVVTYRCNKINYVNRPWEYRIHYDDNFNSAGYGKDRRYDIMKIQRYVKFLWFYRLKTLYKRGE